MKRFRKFKSKKDGDTNQKKVVITKLLSGKMDFSAKRWGLQRAAEGPQRLQGQSGSSVVPLGPVARGRDRQWWWLEWSHVHTQP